MQTSLYMHEGPAPVGRSEGELAFLSTEIIGRCRNAAGAASSWISLNQGAETNYHASIYVCPSYTNYKHPNNWQST